VQRNAVEVEFVLAIPRFVFAVLLAVGLRRPRLLLPIILAERIAERLIDPLIVLIRIIPVGRGHGFTRASRR
jgi:hypothetical protein